MIPLGRPSIDSADIQAMAEVVRSGKLTQGLNVETFEAALAQRLQVKHVIVVNSGTAALSAALAALDIGPGDTVLVPGYSWIATANVVELTGATPVFVDIDRTTFCMDPAHLKETLQHLDDQRQLSSLKAIIPVHAFGYVAALDEIVDLAEAYGVPVIEDAACALGASLDGRAAGTIGLAGCFSFHPLKVLTTGEGGAVATNDDAFADFLRSFRNHGQAFLDGTRKFMTAGANLRMTDFQAALGLSQLNRLSSLLDERRSLVQRYHQKLKGLPLSLQAYERERTTGQALTVLIDRPDLRAKVIEDLSRRGIEAGIGTIAMPFTDYYSEEYGIHASDLPTTWSVGSAAVSLPLFNGMAENEQDIVVEALEQSLQRQG